MENTYGTMKRCFVAGTRNIAKQLLQNYLMLDNHRHLCPARPSLYIAQKDAENRKQEDNSIITVREGSSLTFYRVIASLSDSEHVVSQIKTAPFHCDSTLELDLPWDKVGIYMYCGEGATEKTVSSDEIVGKGVIVQSFIIDFRVNWLQSRRPI